MALAASLGTASVDAAIGALRESGERSEGTDDCILWACSAASRSLGMTEYVPVGLSLRGRSSLETGREGGGAIEGAASVAGTEPGSSIISRYLLLHVEGRMHGSQLEQQARLGG